MPQTKLQVNGIASRDEAKKIIEKGEALESVRMVNANHETGAVVITHFENFNEAEFKQILTDLGYSV